MVWTGAVVGGTVVGLSRIHAVVRRSQRATSIRSDHGPVSWDPRLWIVRTSGVPDTVSRASSAANNALRAHVRGRVVPRSSTSGQCTCRTS